MSEWLIHIDRSVFLFLNGCHSPFLDRIMWAFTQPLTWLPLYVVLLALVIRRFRWQTLWVLLFVAFMVIASDQLSNVVKDGVGRLRPTFEPALSGVHTVNGYLGGTFGFYSAHASTNLAIAIFMILLLGRPFRLFPAVMLLYAFLMSYTRIYLGVHYPGDILAGWVAGGLIGLGCGYLCKWFLTKK